MNHLVFFVTVIGLFSSRGEFDAGATEGATLVTVTVVVSMS